MVGTIILFIKEMYGNKNTFFLSGSVFGGRAGMLTNYFFLFGLILQTLRNCSTNFLRCVHKSDANASMDADAAATKTRV